MMTMTHQTVKLKEKNTKENFFTYVWKDVILMQEKSGYAENPNAISKFKKNPD